MKVRVYDDTKSLHDIGSAIMDYEPARNAFCNALVNRIGLVLMVSRMWNDPWAQFERGTLEYGETVEEIFTNIAKSHSYDPERAEDEWMRRELPDVRAAWHTMNFQKFYKVTISREQLYQAFLSFSDIERLTTDIVNSLYNGMNLDVFLTKKYALARAIVNGDYLTVQHDPIEGAGANPASAIEKFREYTNNLTFLKTTYNRAGVYNSTPVDQQVIIIPNHPEAVLGVNVLADAFNINQVDYISRRIPLDSFEFDASDEARLSELFDDGTYVPFTEDEKKVLASVTGVKCDRDLFVNFVNLMQMETARNGEGMYYQQWLHVWRTFSLSPYANCVVFTTEAGSVTGVTVSPDTANVTQGSSMAMTAEVTTEGIMSKAVAWDISGQTKSATRIDGTTGLLTVSAHEPAGTEIAVTATAVDGTQGKATVTVIAR